MLPLNLAAADAVADVVIAVLATAIANTADDVVTAIVTSDVGANAADAYVGAVDVCGNVMGRTCLS